MVLSNMKTAESAVIEALPLPDGLRGYAGAMGLLPGVRVTLLSRSGGDLVIRVMHSRVAVGRALAERILVRPCCGRESRRA